MRISDWSSDVCSSDLPLRPAWPVSLAAGDKVAIVRPDYFANRKLVEFMGGEIVPVQMDFLDARGRAGLRLDRKSVVEGKGGSDLVDFGGRSTIQKKILKTNVALKRP